MALGSEAERPSRAREMRLFRPKRYWLAAFAALIAVSGAGPCLAQHGPAAAADELDPERLALANEVVDLSYPPAGRRAMLMRASDAMTAQVRAAVTEAAGRRRDAGMERILQRYLDRVRAHTERATDEHGPAIFAAFARAYARQFTRDELIQIRAFVSTPAGRKYVERSVELIADPDVARANTAYMASAISELEPIIAEFRRELEAYLRRRSEQPGRTPPRGTR